jgi:hypothetical protein
MARSMASIAVCISKNLSGLFGLAALVGTGEHFNKRSPLLDQSRSRLIEIVGVLFAHSHGPSLTERLRFGARWPI